MSGEKPSPGGEPEPAKEMSRREVIVAEAVRTIIEAFGVTDIRELEVGDGVSWYQIKEVDAIGNIKKRGFKYTFLIDGIETQYRRKVKGKYVVKTAAELFPRVATARAAVDKVIERKKRKPRGATPVMGDFSHRGGARNALAESRRNHLKQIDERVRSILAENQVGSLTDLEVRFGKTGKWLKIEYFNRITGELTVAGGSLLPPLPIAPRGQAMGRSDKVNILSMELQFSPLKK